MTLLEEYCETNNIMIRYCDFTTKIKGLCVRYDDYYLVAINPKFSNGSQKRTLRHEIIHIMENHFQCDSHDVDRCESEIKRIIRELKFEYANEFYMDTSLKESVLGG